MKKSRKLIALFSVMLIAVAVIFTACKKDKDSEGTKAANELCDCESSSTTDVAYMTCALNFISNYGKYFEIDQSDEEYGMKFTDADFEKDFKATIKNCKAFWEK